MRQDIPQKEMALIIGKRLTKLRGVKTRTGVSRETGIPYSSLCNYEKGRRIPPDSVKIMFAEYYGEDVYSLFYDFS